jgi:hypothetical protein
MKRRLSVQVYYENSMLEAQLYEFITAALNYTEQSTACFSQLLCLPCSMGRTLDAPHHHYEQGGEKHTTLPAIDPRPSSSRSVVLLTELSRLQDNKCFEPTIWNHVEFLQIIPPGNETWIPIQDGGWVGTLEHDTNVLLQPDIKPWILRCPARSLVTTLTVLYWLP